MNKCTEKFKLFSGIHRDIDVNQLLDEISQVKKAYEKLGDANPVHWSETGGPDKTGGYVTRNYEEDQWAPGAMENLGNLTHFEGSQLARIGARRNRYGSLTGGDRNRTFGGLFGSGSGSNLNLSGRQSVKGQVKGYVEGDQQSTNAIEKYLEGKNMTKTTRRDQGTLNIQRDKVKEKKKGFVRKTGEGFLGLQNRKKYIDGVEQDKKGLRRLFNRKQQEESIPTTPPPVQDDGIYFAGNKRMGGPVKYQLLGELTKTVLPNASPEVQKTATGFLNMGKNKLLTKGATNALTRIGGAALGGSAAGVLGMAGPAFGMLDQYDETHEAAFGPMLQEFRDKKDSGLMTEDAYNKLEDTTHLFGGVGGQEGFGMGYKSKMRSGGKLRYK